MSLDDRPSVFTGAYGDPAVAIISVSAVGAVHGMVAYFFLKKKPPPPKQLSRLESRTD